MIYYLLLEDPIASDGHGETASKAEDVRDHCYDGFGLFSRVRFDSVGWFLGWLKMKELIKKNRVVNGLYKSARWRECVKGVVLLAERIGEQRLYR